jgi:hypothetical protein
MCLFLKRSFKMKFQDINSFINHLDKDKLCICSLDKSEWRHGGNVPEVVLFSADENLIKDLKGYLKSTANILTEQPNYFVLYGDISLKQALENISNFLKESKKYTIHTASFELARDEILGYLEKAGYIKFNSEPRSKRVCL